MESRNSSKLTLIVGHDRAIESHCMSSDQQVVRADWPSAAFETCTECAVQAIGRRLEWNDLHAGEHSIYVLG
jgi:hypothetical protein